VGKIGLVVNPVAGLGGRVGLKGSDGAEIQARARALGAEPQAMRRATIALAALIQQFPDLHIITYPDEMGAVSTAKANITAKIIGHLPPEETSARDTIKAARLMRSEGVDLILFSGGDGTARDIYQAIGSDFPVLGIPAGVKVHSGAFAATPQAAGELAVRYIDGKRVGLQLAEVLDVDEGKYRQGVLATQLYGYLSIPYHRRLIPGVKTPSFGNDESVLRAIAAEIVSSMEPGCHYILGPGTTTRAIMQQIGLPKTLLGVDVIQNGDLLAADMNEEGLLAIAKDGNCRIIVTPIGGQGYIFGRGNQQISPAVIAAVGVGQVTIISTPSKIFALQGKPLLVDTGDVKVDAELAGMHKVVTGLGDAMIYRVVGGLNAEEV